jgi:hypothetical protein
VQDLGDALVDAAPRTGQRNFSVNRDAHSPTSTTKSALADRPHLIGSRALPAVSSGRPATATRAAHARIPYEIPEPVARS